MTHVINDECVACAECLQECPVEAIVEGEEKYDVDEEECVDCGNCAEVCPIEAIYEEEE
ncbi:indolepyruvate ferredoxin oxidoreductase subunit alpha [Fuchsiella alkaliacetigena]|uniref:indolepyruvate ferredoxin oxidoreductase subunit alpha n=1 Tax=Fuchsiella alkaliacetigena TaxID=957042 RepID=UPI00200A4F08|nr:4Fe-4S binding protein [Fuchsiella alkaliacetigena]MCK8824008.1 4Fe-4S binding protein [Fuchsiella alkaliacetigena]